MGGKKETDVHKAMIFVKSNFLLWFVYLDIVLALVIFILGLLNKLNYSFW